jgi:hypothetical protein
MDIMNNMTVSTSKLTFSLIAITALLISGSAFLNQEADAAITFTAFANTTTTTQVKFSEVVNGTIVIADWQITLTGARASEAITVTDVQNRSHIGTGAQVNHDNFFNNTQFLTIIHNPIPSDAEYNLNFTKDVTKALAGHVVQKDGHTEGTAVLLLSGVDATIKDHMSPTIVSAEILKSNPKQVQVLMSEKVANVNVTGQDGARAFSFAVTGGSNQVQASSFVAENVTGSKLMYVNLDNGVNPTDVVTIAYTQLATQWITDGINSEAYPTHQHQVGHGNRLASFGVTSVVNWLEIGMFGDVTTCYDCAAPVVTDVKVSLDSSTPITVNDNNQVHINAGIDDTVSVMVTVADNLGADTIPFAGIYTNFGATPDNLYYANNFDSAKQMSTSYYEWNVRTDDVAFDNHGAITWTDATAKVNPDRTQTFTYTMTINDSLDASQVWVDIGDKAGNYAKLALPITLEVSGAPGLTFASDDTQKVVSFFNESILLAIVSQWTATSSDDASNVEQLSSVLGIEGQLPTWTTELASWVADDKIDVADMIVAVEYVINA